jgi:hypothetical protein
MFPFPYTGLRLVHDEKVRDAMERACIDAELARNSRRTVQLSLLRNVLMRIGSRLNIFVRSEHLRRRTRALATGDTRDSRLSRSNVLPPSTVAGWSVARNVAMPSTTRRKNKIESP